MRAIDLSTNLAQMSEVGRVHRAADQHDEHGRRSQATDAQHRAMRRQEQVARAPAPQDARVERDGRESGGEGQGEDRRGDEEQASPRETGGVSAGPEYKGRLLDIQV